MSTQSIPSDHYDEVFFRVDEQMPVNTVITWEDACADYFQVSLEGLVPAEIADLRNRFKTLVNHRAARYGANWRLGMFEFNKSIIKRENSEMVQTEMADRIDRVASGFRLIVRNLRPMLAVESLPAKDKKAIRQMVNIAMGGAMNVQGAIFQMTSINKSERLALAEAFSSIANQDEDEA